jgi:sterol desaturase/sphingolipid hydroxylase (fatty acid hydroxylase superfamily)
MWQFIVFLAVEEVTFYFAHRLIHLPQFYWIHKDHHEYNVTIALAAQYAHPIEQILANSIPAGLGYKMLSKVYPVHMVAIIIWLSFRLFETCDGHSGYNWPWGQSQLLPFSAGGSYHYFHHKQNVGNYGAIMTIFDTIFDTNKDYNKYEDLKKKKLRND